MYRAGQTNQQLASKKWRRGAAILCACVLTTLGYLFLHQTTLAAQQSADGRVLAMLAIAYDINPDSRRNLSAEYQETVDMLINATQSNHNLSVLALVDMPGPNNSFVLRVNNGIVHQLAWLPNKNGSMTPALREYNMADGEQLGGFILWARQQIPAERSIFSFIGHGGPVIPADVDFTDILNGSTGSESRSQSGDIFVWPSHVSANPDVTDWHDQDIISPHDLKIALEKGTSNNLGKIDVADLVHCFAGTVEELHEIGDYAEIITASPNYAFYTASMPGRALQEVNASMSPAAIADTLLSSYHDTLPNDGYPRVMVAVDSSHLPTVKAHWDELANEILNAPIDVDMKVELAEVYEASHKYEATVLEPANWTLESPDALVDLADFSSELRRRFGIGSPIGQQASETMLALSRAVTSRYECEGQPDPSYAPNWEKQTQPYGCHGMPNAPWQFADHPGSGISLFAPLGVEIIDGDKYGPWQAVWYDKADVTRTPAVTNSLSFIEGDQPTWANVINDYWAGETILTQFSLPAFAPVRERGEISAEFILPSPNRPNAVSLNHPIRPAIALHSAQPANGPLVDITIEQAGTTVFTDTFSVGYIVTGTHPIRARQQWTPTLTGTYTITVVVDADDRIIEQNEQDNTLVMSGVVRAARAHPANDYQIGDQDFVTGTQPITTEVVPVINLDRVWLRLYQFEQLNVDSRVLSPTVRWSGALPLDGNGFDLAPDVLGLQPGAIELHIWSGTLADGILSVEPRRLRFNYAPPETQIEAGSQHVYWAGLDLYEQFGVGVASSAEINLYIWYPYNHWQPNQAQSVIDVHSSNINAPFSGLYLIAVENPAVCVDGSTCQLASYTLHTARGQSPIRQSSPPILPLQSPAARPEIVLPTGEPDPEWSAAPTSVAYDEGTVGIRPNLILFLFATTLLLLTITFRKRSNN